VGRGRGRFREGATEAERAYAQVLRDIRDARGETQEALGNLLGWSVSTVSRFEAGGECPDRATHRRYCALAPTDELRKRVARAYKSLSLSQSPRRAAVIRRSPEEWHSRALEGPGLYRLLGDKYREYPTLKLFDDESRHLPVWAEPALRNQWEDVEAALGSLDLSRPAPQVRQWAYWEDCDPSAEDEFERHLAEWDQQVRDIRAGRRRHLDTWNQLTYDLASMERGSDGVKLHCKLGTYFHSLATSESLHAEIMETYSAWPDYEPEEGWAKLEGRRWLHERVADPAADGRHRSAAIGVSTLTVVRVRREDFDGYKMFLSPRSMTVATQRGRYHVIPSGMFQPFIADESPEVLRSQFSIHATVVREFVEELYGVEELETGDGRVDHTAIYRRREAQVLAEMLKTGDAKLLYTGVAVNLLALRPEICTLLVIDDPGWYEEESGQLRICDEYLRQSERVDLLPDQRWVQLIALDSDGQPESAWQDVLRPATLVAPGWAGVVLGLRVAREVIG
jgi:transcriptional regulator with XRE-family HTH domain